MLKGPSDICTGQDQNTYMGTNTTDVAFFVWNYYKQFDILEVVIYTLLCYHFVLTS